MPSGWTDTCWISSGRPGAFSGSSVCFPAAGKCHASYSVESRDHEGRVLGAHMPKLGIHLLRRDGGFSSVNPTMPHGRQARDRWLSPAGVSFVSEIDATGDGVLVEAAVADVERIRS